MDVRLPSGTGSMLCDAAWATRTGRGKAHVGGCYKPCVELVFLDASRNLEVPHGKIAPKSVQTFSPSHGIEKDRAAAYLQCLVDERDNLECRTQVET